MNGDYQSETGAWRRLMTAEDLEIAMGLGIGELSSLISSLPTHYERRYLRSPTGKRRPIDIPSSSLCAVNRKLTRWFQEVPVSEAAHGWVPGRSIVTHAREHVGMKTLIHVDIQACFPNTHYSRISKVFAGWGCGAEAVEALTKLTTWRYCLPQGLPSSPVLLNIVFRELDDRLQRLAKQHSFVYSRFGDDMSFSGDHRGDKLIEMLRVVVSQFGYSINERKFEQTGMQTRKSRQVVWWLIRSRTSRRRLGGVFAHWFTMLPIIRKGSSAPENQLST